MPASPIDTGHHGASARGSEQAALPEALNVHAEGLAQSCSGDSYSGDSYSGPPGARPLAPPVDLVSAVESLLFVAEQPVEPAALAQVLNAGVTAILAAIATLAERCRERGIRIQQGGGRVQLISAPELGPYVERFLGAVAEQKLSTAALETLAIVAYRQPATRPAIEAIRGVNSERALLTLRARGLVEEVGRAGTVGHPVLFGTTMRFLEYFGLEHPGDLPPLPGAVEIGGEVPGESGAESPSLPGNRHL